MKAIVKLAKNENVLALVSTFFALGIIITIIVISVYLESFYQAY